LRLRLLFVFAPGRAAAPILLSVKKGYQGYNPGCNE
jgi:hypothetical protein